jgi:heat shock protein HslJ
MSIFACRPGRLPGFFAAAVVVATGLAWDTSVAAERSFPFDQELMLDARPMKGSKRVPIIEVGASGEASIDMWCNTVKAQLVVAGDTITVVTGTKTDRQCTPERVRGDDDLLAVLGQVTNWRRDDELLTLRGARTVRFRLGTH